MDGRIERVLDHSDERIERQRERDGQLFVQLERRPCTVGHLVDRRADVHAVTGGRMQPDDLVE